MTFRGAALAALFAFVCMPASSSALVSAVEAPLASAAESLPVSAADSAVWPAGSTAESSRAAPACETTAAFHAWAADMAKKGVDVEIMAVPAENVAAFFARVKAALGRPPFDETRIAVIELAGVAGTVSVVIRFVDKDTCTIGTATVARQRAAEWFRGIRDPALAPEHLPLVLPHGLRNV
jgi:hypothetical protein